ncbi:MAG: VanZ family protein, partial [Bacteroidota bacterium]
MKTHIIWFLPAIVVALGIFLLSTFLSFPVQVEGVNYLDKIEHCFAYFVLVLSFLIAYKKSGVLTKKITRNILLFSALYGFLLELVQYVFFSYRYFEWIDAGANIL